MALQHRYDRLAPAPKERAPVPGEKELANLKAGPEARFIALGERHYREMDLDDGKIREVEDELRRARMYEYLTVNRSMRLMELDEQRRRVAEEQAREAERQQHRVVTATMLRQQALAALQVEAETIRQQREETLAADRRAVLQREKERLMERRRLFEASQHADLHGSPARTAAASASRARTPGGNSMIDSTPPVLVMTVALGDGKEDKLIVRQSDDPKRVAVTFARKHRLPEHAVHTLQQQIRQNLEASAARRTPTPSRPREPSMMAAATSRQSPAGPRGGFAY